MTTILKKLFQALPASLLQRTVSFAFSQTDMALTTLSMATNSTSSTMWPCGIDAVAAWTREADAKKKDAHRQIWMRSSKS